MTGLFTALIVTEIIVVIKDRILAKNNQKKEKAERNKANAEKFKKDQKIPDLEIEDQTAKANSQIL